MDKYCPSSSSRVCSYSFHTEVGHYDMLFIGMENGKIFTMQITAGQLPHNVRPIDITKDAGTQHSAEVSCLLYSNHKRFINHQNNGLLFSGSLDRSIKIWSVSVGNQTVPVQTLFGHDSTISKLVDSSDGNILSCSEDGSLRMWSPQRGRNMMLHPFFECTFTMSFGRDVWLTAITVGILGPWICYAADSNGNIEVLKKGSEHNEVERHMATFMNQLTRAARWEKVHALGITHLELIREENILVSLSYDATCKVLDPSTGQVVFQISNKRRCMYTGATWVKNLTSFYLIDEFGLLDVFNLYHERVIETVELSTLSSKQNSAVLKCHAGQALRDIGKFNQDGYFLTLLAHSHADTKATKIAAMNGGSGTSRLKSVGVIGDVVLWNLSNDVNCMEFVGHGGSVVGISVPSFTGASAARTHTVALDGSLTAGLVGAAAAAAAAADSAASGPLSAANHQIAMRASTLQISSAEKLFFSAGHEDDTIRCWDEYDQSETYQYRSKGVSEITVMLAVWHMNRIVTGHENGTVCIWNADTGARVLSKVLRHTVSSLCEASSAHTKLLLGADYSGRVALWNLTLHYLNPTQLISVGSDFDGFHCREDPGILSLTFHDRTKTAFSGGNDTSVQFWRLHSDIPSGHSNTHKESVSLLRCTGSFLLSGDEEGNLHLCRILMSSEVKKATAASTHASKSAVSSAALSSVFVTGLSVLCAWNTYPVTMRALGDLCELDLTTSAKAAGGGGSAYGGGKRVLVSHVGAVGSGRTRVWEVWTQKRSSAPQHRTHRTAGGGLEGLRQAAAQLQHELSLSAANSIAGDGGGSLHQEGSSVFRGGVLGGGDSTIGGAFGVGGDEDEDTPLDEKGRYRVFDQLHPDLYISVSELYSLNHDKYEISCCTMATSSTIATPVTVTSASSKKSSVDRLPSIIHSSGGAPQQPAAAATTAVGGEQQYDALETFRQSTLVYMGTTNGMIFRFSFRKY